MRLGNDQVDADLAAAVAEPGWVVGVDIVVTVALQGLSRFG